jgi:hypothetical protein
MYVAGFNGWMHKTAKLKSDAKARLWDVLLVFVAIRSVFHEKKVQEPDMGCDERDATKVSQPLIILLWLSLRTSALSGVFLFGESAGRLRSGSGSFGERPEGSASGGPQSMVSNWRCWTLLKVTSLAQAKDTHGSLVVAGWLKLCTWTTVDG